MVKLHLGSSLDLHMAEMMDDYRSFAVKSQVHVDGLCRFKENNSIIHLI